MSDQTDLGVVLEAYFDESGFTGDKLHPEQVNLLFAGIVIPMDNENPFWDSVSRAWYLAGDILCLSPHSVELKGAEIYGGKGPFKNVDLEQRCKILDAIFSSIETPRILVMWDGAPKHRWLEFLSQHGKSNKDHPLFKSFLMAFCDQLYELLSTLFPEGILHIVGDENNWIGAGQLMTFDPPNRWSRMRHGGIQFCQSAGPHGLQLADIVAHTLYRANKNQLANASGDVPVLSNTDNIAVSFHNRLEQARLWINLTANCEELRLRRGGSTNLD